MVWETLTPLECFCSPVVQVPVEGPSFNSGASLTLKGEEFDFFNCSFVGEDADPVFLGVGENLDSSVEAGRQVLKDLFSS